jgi:predicted AAA+ superfamily ATPase
MPRLRNDTPIDKWYKYGKGDKLFYSPFPKYEYTINVAGEGKKEANPLEIADLLKDLLEKEDSAIHKINKFGSVYVVDDGKQLPGVELPSGTYKYVYDSFTGTQKLVPMEFREDHYIEFSSVNEAFIRDFKDFVENEEIYRKLNTIYKEGFLPFGPPGNGKTATIRHLVKKCMPEGSVVIVIDKDLPTTPFIQAMRKTLADRFKIFIFEEFTHFTKDYNDMEEVLSFLDGESSLDKSLLIATTNYPENLPGNIVERPSRFDKFYEFGNPNSIERKLLLDYYLMRNCTPDEVIATQDMSIASIKEVCLLSYKRKISTIDAISCIKKQTKLARDHFKKTGKLGI